MNTLMKKTGLYRWIILVAFIGIFCGVQVADAGCDLWTRDPNRYKLEPNEPNDWLDVNDVNVSGLLIAPEITGTVPERLGSELVTNGTFAVDANWTKEGVWTISGGEACFFENDPDYSYSLYQDIAIETGRKYRVKFTITYWDEDYESEEGFFCVYFGTTTSQEIVCLDENDGAKSYSYDVTATQGGRIRFEAGTSSNEWAWLDINLDDVSVREIFSDESVGDVHIDPNLFVENNLDASGDANIAGNLTVGGKINDSNTADWDDAYDKRVVTWNPPLLFSNNDVSLGAGPNLEIVGNNVYIKTEYSLSNDVLHNNSTFRFTTEASPYKLKETKINADIGSNVTLRISFDMELYCNDSQCYYVYGQIYRNGSPVGTLRSTDSESWVTFTEDISGWSNGDLLQLYGYTDGYDEDCEVQNLKIKGTLSFATPAIDCTSQDP